VLSSQSRDISTFPKIIQGPRPPAIAGIMIQLLTTAIIRISWMILVQLRVQTATLSRHEILYGYVSPS
jgi:hypothetical protein